MSKCKFCGAESAVDAKFCSSCGAKVQETPAVEVVLDPQNTNGENSTATASTPANQRRPMRGGMLAWSIANTILGLFGCCGCLPIVSTILGVIAIVFVILAQDAGTDQLEKSKIRIATILNTISSILLILSLIFGIIFLIYNWQSYTPYPYNTFDLDEFMRMYPYVD